MKDGACAVKGDRMAEVGRAKGLESPGAFQIFMGEELTRITRAQGCGASIEFAPGIETVAVPRDPPRADNSKGEPR